ncbi:GH3 auxin-responsive promoter family protein [Seohaeicola saemankumensis]|nr:GH3 auxin-responsive promoter family protein [Seohaeicola saemankumensis]MCA0869975.1 GH3 auxin-responsive promoter family protein [Seohaeicola saemankumensis]
MRDVTPLVRRYAQARLWRLTRQAPDRAQAALLRRLLRAARHTRFGRAHDFRGIRNVDSYQKQVPVRGYSAFWQDWWQAAYPDLVDQTWPGRIPSFSMTSGTTTGRSKYIPHTPAMKRAAVRGFVDLLCHHLVLRPNSRVLGGTALGLVGPVDLTEAAPGVDVGAVSAITANALPGWLAPRVLPPREIAELTNWQEKISRLAPLSLEKDVRFLGGSPNWLLLFLDEVAKARPGRAGRLADWYPGLELIVHGGVNFAPYRQRFAELMQGGHAETREMYSASEGVFAYADRGDGEGMRLHLDGQVFFEFIPAAQARDNNPERFWVGNIETGVDYALAVTTAAGLWSYLVGDVVRFVDLSPPRLIVVGRVENGLSAFGEHLIEAEIADAVAAAAAATHVSILDYCVGPVPQAGRNRHIYLIEIVERARPDTAGALAARIDESLRIQNEDYAELRKSDLALAAPEVHLVAPGGFMRWMKQRRGLGGQYKVPRIVTDPSLLGDIQTMVLDHSIGGPAHDA